MSQLSNIESQIRNIDNINLEPIYHSVTVSFKEKSKSKFDDEHDTISEYASTFGDSILSASNIGKYDDFCVTCKDIIAELQEEKRQLGLQLIEGGFNTASDTCRCRLKQDIEVIQREERCLLETIELKKERIENLKQADKKLDSDIEIARKGTSDKMVTYNDIVRCQERTEKSYKEILNAIKEKQRLYHESENYIHKLKNDVIEIEKQQKIQTQIFHDKNQILNELIKNCKDTEYKINQQKKLFMDFDAVSTDFQSKITNLKGEIKMLVESQEFHQEEVEKRTIQLQRWKEEKQKTVALVEKVHAEQTTLQETIQSQNKLKSENEKLYTSLKLEIHELVKLIENQKLTKNNSIHELENMKEEVEKLAIEMNSDKENYDRICSLIDEIKAGRNIAEDELINMINTDKSKIKKIIEECARYETMFKDSLLVRRLLEKDNNKLEQSIVGIPEVPDELHALNLWLKNNIPLEELEIRLSKHQKLIQMLRENFEVAPLKKFGSKIQDDCCTAMKQELAKPGGFSLLKDSNKQEQHHKELELVKIEYNRGR